MTMLWLLSILLLVAFIAGANGASQAGSPTATLDVEKVIGTTTVLPSSTVTVNQFLGVPFAISPPKRFSPPEPVGKFEKPVVAQAHSPACMQQFNYPEASRAFTIAAFGGGEEESEDCLYLNIFAPDTPGREKAVLFWLYGGGLQFGSAGHPIYDGSSFASNQDVVVVAANYRTNVFGFSSSPQIPVDSRNAGFFDQRLALDWVQRNIEAFGGDPSKVTIFGESAGAQSVDNLVLSPPDPIPFRAAIGQSGTAILPAITDVGDVGVESWKFLVGALNCSGTDDVLECVRQAEAVKIKDIIEHSALRFTPVGDNITQLTAPINRTTHQTVPFMVGSNGQEGTIMSVGQTNLTGYLEATFRTQSDELRRLLADFYAIGTPGIKSEWDAIAQIYTEFAFQCPTAIAASKSAIGSFPTWRYYYNATFPNLYPEEALEKLGLGGLELRAYHSSEIPLIFGTYPRENATDEQVALSKFMQTAWAKFAENPDSGPGWSSYGTGDVNAVGLAVLDKQKGQNLNMIPQYSVDHRCPLYNGIYGTSLNG